MELEELRLDFELLEDLELLDFELEELEDLLEELLDRELELLEDDLLLLELLLLEELELDPHSQFSLLPWFTHSCDVIGIPPRASLSLTLQYLMLIAPETLKNHC